MERVDMIEKKVLSYMEKHTMLLPGEGILLGVSGGADSVCLLFLLHKFAATENRKLVVVHVNHGIRETAGRDEAYVKELCWKLHLPFYAVHENIHEVAKKQGMSVEEAGRRVRYEAFLRIAKEEGCTKIALAHNSNDRAETMLFFLFRGAGLRGLAGIRPCREQFIRPILCLTRKEIEDYLKEREISFCQDETNDGDDYTRNRIRHHILPYAEKEIFEGATEHISRTGEYLALAQDYIDAETEKFRAGLLSKDGEKYSIPVEKLLQAHPFLQQQVILSCLYELVPGKKDITATHVEQVLSLFLQQSGRLVTLPYGLTAYRSYDNVLLERQQEKEHEIPSSIEIIRDGKLLTNQEIWGDRTYTFRTRPFQKDSEIPRNQYTKWFDYDKIKSLALRTKEAGDYLTIKGEKDRILHKKLKEYLIGEKIPKDERDSLAIMASEHHVVWVTGYRVSEEFKVTEETKTVLEVTVNAI